MNKKQLNTPFDNDTHMLRKGIDELYDVGDTMISVGTVPLMLHR